MRGKPPSARPPLRAFFALALVLLLFGCELYGTVGGDNANIQGSLPDLLRGEWAYLPGTSGAPSDGYIINGDLIEYVYHREGGSEMDFKGKIVFVSNYSSGSGLIIIEYTVPPSYPDYNGNAFCAVYYRNLKSNSVQVANTTTFPGNTCADTATLEEAKAKFTRMTMGNYVNWSIVQPQTRIR
jgi:hypothetical protein